MLQTYTVSSNGISLGTGDSVPFNINDISSRCGVSHIAGSNVIDITQRGYYQINFSSVGYNTGEVVEGTDYSGTYSFQLYNKEVPIVNAVASATSTSSTNIENVGFSVIIYVPPSCQMVNNNASLSVRYLGQEGIFSNVSLSVIKLD